MIRFVVTGYTIFYGENSSPGLNLYFMNKQGEIIIVDDDQDDCEILSDTLKSLNIQNKIICFNYVTDVLTHLRKIDSDPFIIFSDIRMPTINGFELKQMIHADKHLIKKSIPFILFSTTIDSNVFTTALSVGVQGIFTKPVLINDLKIKLEAIMNYFNDCFGN